MVARLEALISQVAPILNKGRGAAAEIRRNRELSAEISALHLHYFGRRVSGCSSCFMDAAVTLYKKLKNIRNMGESKFELRAGALLKDVVAHRARLMMVKGRETDELALYHLHTNPSCISKFERLPKDAELKKMLAEYAKSYAAEHEAPEGATGVSEDAIAEARTAAEAKGAEIIAEAEAKGAEIIAEAEAKGAEIIAEAEAKGAEKSNKAKKATTTTADPTLD